MVTHQFSPKGVCSRNMEVTLNDDGTIAKVEIVGGCNGNLAGISSLIQGMKAEDAIARMAGIRCNFKPTSCPDQLSIGLTQAMEKLAQNG